MGKDIVKDQSLCVSYVERLLGTCVLHELYNLVSSWATIYHILVVL